MLQLYGLIGFPLTHSFSAGYFTEKFAREGIDAAYRNFPLENIERYSDLLIGHPDLRGLNVTIPYKEKIIPLLNALSPEAATIGAVNCISVKNGITTGYNTDIIGFTQSLEPLLRPHHRQALILGTGGASKAVARALENMGLHFRFVSRQAGTGAVTYQELETYIPDYTVIINTTPAGTFPDVTAHPPIPYFLLTPQHLLYDLVYNPDPTTFLTLGAQQGAATKNGLEMLHLQAEAAWKIWQEQ
ncbi:shikimate dehydrogenase family protein [Chitinophagaceae bacterium MMS25-I14]